jgi:NADH-quinone oxidoreductase subunit L
LAIAGIPPLSGFFSKDEILVAAFEHNKTVFAVQWLVAGITAFYMFRLYFSIFWNHTPVFKHTPHESPVTMTLPLIILAIASVAAGFVPFHELVTSDGKPFNPEFHWMIAMVSVLVALTGIWVAALLYYKESTGPENITRRVRGFYTAAFRKFYIDELYLYITRNVIFGFISRPVAWFDKHIVDGTMNLVGNTTMLTSGAIRKMQSGQLQMYIWFFTSGALLLTLIILCLN